MAGLQAIGASHLAQQGIAVALGDGLAGTHGLAPGEAFLLVEAGVEIGEIADGGFGDHGQIAGGHIFVRIRPAIGVGEIAALQAQALGFAVHQRDVIGFGTAQPFGQHHARIIARQGDDAVQQVFNAHLAVHVQEHGAALVVPRLPGFLTHQDRLFQIGFARLDQLEGNIDAHHLAHRCRRDALVGILGQQDTTGLQVFQEGDGGRSGIGRGLRKGGRGGKEQSNRSNQAHQNFRPWVNQRDVVGGISLASA